MPDVNSFNYLDDIPQFAKDRAQDQEGFQQLSMWQAAINGFFHRSAWAKELETSRPFHTTGGASRELFTSYVMRLGMKSLELLVPGGVEKLEADLERIANGICKLDEEESELQVDEASAADARASRRYRRPLVMGGAILRSFVYALRVDRNYKQLPRYRRRRLRCGNA
jgi:hypothetical protein